MSLTLLLRGTCGDSPPVIFDNGELTPLDARVRRIMEGISPLIRSQVPDFVSMDHPIFVAFLEAYYEWMEQQGNATERTLLLHDNYDIETTLDEFVESFEDRFMKNVPRVFDADTDGNVLDRKKLLTRMKDFYAVKGTEKSFEFFFHAFYNSICEFYYPRTDLLEVSGGNWIEKKSIRLTSDNGTSNFNMNGKVVTRLADDGVFEAATASVVDVVQYFSFPYTVTELFLTNIQGDFTAGNLAKVTLDDGTTLTETIFGLIKDFEIVNGGLGYKIGDKVVITNEGSGIGAAASVSRVDDKGKILDIAIEDHGINYTEESTFVIRSESGNGNAVGNIVLSGLAEKDGFFFDDGGKPSSRKKIQDGDYYQRFSYVLKTNLSLKKYVTALKALIHPAGYKVFGDVLLTKKLTSDLPFHSQTKIEEVSMIGNYTPYTFGTTQDLRSNNSTSGTSVDLYPNGYAPGNGGVGSNDVVNGTVPEDGITAHLVGSGVCGPLGTAGAEGASAAESLGLDFFPVYHHPNMRGLDDIAAGTSMGGTELDPFFFIPVGGHLHTNPTYSTWTDPLYPYNGDTAGGGTHDQYYNYAYGTTSESPNV